MADSPAEIDPIGLQLRAVHPLDEVKNTETEGAVLDGRDGNVDGVLEHAPWGGRPLDGLLQAIQAAGLDGETDGVLELPVREAPVKESLDDDEEALVDRRRVLLGAVLLAHAELNVAVHALGEERLLELVGASDVEVDAGTEGVGQGVVEFAEVVEDLGGHQSGEFAICMRPGRARGRRR